MRIERRGRRALLVLAMLAAGGIAAAADTARLPKPRPVTAPPAETIAWAGAAETRFQDAILAVEGLARLPRSRPASPVLLAMVAPEEATPAPVPPMIAPPIVTESDADFSACTEDLAALGVVYEAIAPIDDSNGCHIARPLRVTALGSGVAIAPETLLNCATTRALATWVRDVLVPASQRTLAEKPSAIRQGSAFVCRNRYNDPDAEISEHALANAIDIAAIAFAGRDDVGIGVNEAGSPEADLEAAIREGGCKHFTTVLGPGSNEAHETHLHFDLAKRNGSYRLCELGAPKMVRGPENTARE